MLTTLYKKLQSVTSKLNVIQCNSLSFIWVSALVFTACFNIAFFAKVIDALGMNNKDDYLLFGSFIIFIFCVLNILFTLFFIKPIRKPLLVLLLCCSALGSYFSLFYGIYIDNDMLVNIFQTNTYEAITLLNGKLVLWFIIFGLLPSLFVIFFIKVKKISFLKSATLRTVNILISVAILGALYFSLPGEYSFFLKTNKSTLKLISPTNYIYALGDMVNKHYKSEAPFTHIGEDAKRKIATNPQKKKLIIIVVGETSRAQNFSLNGYERETNPLLSKQSNLFNFEHASSCGTATAISVPCMFSNMPRKSFDRTLAINEDNVLDIIARTGVNVYWKDNDSNCKEVCNRVPTLEINKTEPAELCKGGLCYDIQLLNGLDQYINERTDDTVIVIHTNGSHGPAYHERYQKDQEKFTPACKSTEIDSCSQQELVNAYDNTIVNVDFVLNSTIELLKKHSDQFSTAMLYMSDHGESLGEDGFYLHGAPYRIAPKQQTHIPMIFWLSDSFMNNHRINKTCLADKAKNDQNVSHDNLFHTVLGALDVSTKEYDPSLDIFKSCE
ncbi:phosphoethanolamine transferase EptA [Gammaproteobacteria bacterium ESL0073]|nr:phosphoethanolamine transferase EptA [Gammaproteobacteria bacterium ESL0073]